MRRVKCTNWLAHVSTNAVGAGYRQTDLFERRWVHMEQLGAFLAGATGAEAGLVA